MRSETNEELADKLKRLATDMPSEEKAIVEDAALRLCAPPVLEGVEVGDKLAEQIVVLIAATPGNPDQISAIFSGEFSPGDLPIYHQQAEMHLEAVAVDDDAPVNAVGDKTIDQGGVDTDGKLRPDPAGISGSLEEAYGVDVKAPNAA